MNFGKQLSEYMKILDCNTNELAESSSLSYMLINRYINNIRKPKVDSEYFNSIADGLYKIALKKEIKVTKKEIIDNLKKSLESNSSVDFDLFIDNFNLLQRELNITTVDISKATGYDSSFISRMKNKERKPADLNNFIDQLSNYIFPLLSNEQMKDTILKLFGCPANEIENLNTFKDVFSNWVSLTHIESNTDNVINFLYKLDSFNLNDYIGTDFSKVKALPTTPVIIKNSKTFFGVEGRKQSEADFLKITLLSKSEEPIFFYSDLPMLEAAEDKDFKSKWIFVITKLLKKGLHLNIVHNLNRPLAEMFLGLEGWVPIYMTGSITPYYFKTPPSNFFLGSHCTSGSVALNGECLNHDEKKGKYILTTKKDEVEYEKEKSKYMLSKATPLMNIYKESDLKKFEYFLEKDENKNYHKITKDIFKNIDFYLSPNKWVSINKKTKPEIHFVIYHEKLLNAIQSFLLI